VAAVLIIKPAVCNYFLQVRGFLLGSKASPLLVDAKLYVIGNRCVNNLPKSYAAKNRTCDIATAISTPCVAFEKCYLKIERIRNAFLI